MKKLVGIFAILLVLTACQEKQKIVFIDSNKVFDEYQEKIDSDAAFKLVQENFKKKTDSIGRAYQVEAGALQAKLGRLSQEQQQQNPELQVFSQKWNVVQQQVQFEEQGLKQKFETELKAIDSSIVSFITDYAKKNKIAFVLGKNNTGGVMYGDEKSDITEAVITDLNAAYKKEDSKTSDTETKPETTETKEESK